MQQSLLASLHRADASRNLARYQLSLHLWKESAAQNELRAREEVLNRILAWQSANVADAGLDLSASSLRQECGIDETLTDLPPLPPGLERVELSGHRLGTLDATKLPDTLRLLDASSNALTDLPDNLPASLCHLYIEHNYLERLPETLPDSLEELHAADNQLESLPARLPAALETMDVSNNYLESLPDNLPDALEELNAEKNHLDGLPARWPPNLRVLKVDDNYLQHVPEGWPDTLEELHAANNQIVRLPVGLREALAICLVENNPIGWSDDSEDEVSSDAPTDSANASEPSIDSASDAEEEVDSADAASDSTGESGPADATAAPAGPSNLYGVGRSSATLGEAVLSWYGNRSPGYASVWATIRREAIGRDNGIPLSQLAALDEHALNAAHSGGRLTDPTAPFWAFLDSLGATEEAKVNRDFRQRVATLLDAMESDDILRQSCFHLAHGAVETCHDNVTLGFNQMELEHLKRRAAKGDFTPEEVFTLGMNAFKLEMLDHLARNKARAMGNDTEELVVVLYYRMRLAGKLQLPHQSRGHVHFRRDAVRGMEGNHIRKRDLDEAAAHVQSAARDVKAMIDFLKDWEPWQQDLARRFPERFSASALEDRKSALQERLAELFENNDLDEGPKLQMIKALQEEYDTIDTRLFRDERERLTREFVMRQVAPAGDASGSK